MANNTNSNKQRNGKLSLYPLKFEEAVKEILEIKPQPKTNINDEIQSKKKG